MASTVQVWIASLLLVVATTVAAAQDRAASEIVRSGASVDEPPRPSQSRDIELPIPPEPFHASPSRPETTNDASTPAARPIPLAARSDRDRSEGTRTLGTNPAESLITIGGSLCVVLSLFFGLAWLTRRGQARGGGRLPDEIIEVLGKAPLVKGQELQLVRIGTKLLLLCVSANGCETLTEINDDEEVDRLAAVCRRESPSSVTAAFNQVLSSLGREPARGFTNDPRTRSARREVRYHA